MSKKRKIFLGICSVLILFFLTLAGGVLYLYHHPEKVKPLIANAVSGATGAACSIDKFSCTFRPLSVRAEGIHLKPGEAHRGFELVIPSLDAGSDTFFQYVNRPHPEITFDQMVQGLIDFRKEYQGKYWLEVFLLGGVTSTDQEIQKLKYWIGQIAPN